MPSFLQPALGNGIGITDYRSHCQMHASLAKDMKTTSERDLRESMMRDPSKTKDATTRYIPVAPYFETDRCWTTQNPPVQFPHYNAL